MKQTIIENIVDSAALRINTHPDYVKYMYDHDANVQLIIKKAINDIFEITQTAAANIKSTAVLPTKKQVLSYKRK